LSSSWCNLSSVCSPSVVVFYLFLNGEHTEEFWEVVVKISLFDSIFLTDLLNGMIKIGNALKNVKN
jgi:hypothetical protein